MDYVNQLKQPIDDRGGLIILALLKYSYKNDINY